MTEGANLNLIKRFICIEGTDGSGKEVQSQCLVARLRSEGYHVSFFDFPQYDKTFFGEMAGKMLAGDYGPIENIDPHLASLVYAFDRWQASSEIKKTITEGGIAVANRFTLSNMAHQAARLPVDQRKEFVKFVLKLENEILGLPTPDLYIFLEVSLEVSQRLIASKLERKHLKGLGFDLLEKDKNHQIEAARMYIELSDSIPNLVRISCCDGFGRLKDVDNIHEMIWAETIRSLSMNLEGQSKGRER